MQLCNKAALFAVLALSIAAVGALACSSTSEDFRIRSVTVNVQPSQPVLVQRYQAPEIRIFCFSTEQISGIDSAACSSSSTTTSTNALWLCKRRADSPDSTTECEQFTDINSETQRGTINGPEMVWDLLWDGSKLSPQCFPRGVRFSYLALVRGANVSSVGLLVILLIIAILALLLGILSLGVFVRQRIYIFDTAGAISIAGPKGDFAGHQMQVRAGAAEDAQADYDGQVPTMYLPVSKNGDDSALHGAELGADLTEEQRAEMRAQNAMHSASAHGTASRVPRAIAMKGASPPRPGDGIEGFEGAVRDMEFANAESAGGRPFEGIGTGKYRDGGPGSSIRRRRGYKPHVGSSPGRGLDYDDDGFAGRGGPSGRRNKALFPTHYDFETNDGTSVGGGAPFGGGRQQRDGFDRDSSGRYVDENGVPYMQRGGQGVRYVPQWMHAFHGRDENGEVADAFEGEPGVGAAGPDGLNNSSAGPFDGSSSSARPRGLQTVSELGVYNRPSKKLASGRGGKPVAPGEEADEADGYESEGGRKVRFAGEASGGSRKKTPQSGRQTPNSRRGSTNDGASGSASASGAGGKKRGGLAAAAAPNERGDRFNRGRANVYNDSLQLGKNRDFSDRGAADSGAERVDVVRRFGDGGADEQDPTRTSLAEQGPRPVLQCANCKVLLMPGRAPQFCAVSGESHF